MTSQDQSLARQTPPDVIVASWMRCRQHGLAPHARMEPCVIPTRELQRHRERSRQLRSFALQEMQALEPVLAASGRIMLLADAEGVVLDSHGDLELLGRALRISLMPGASWQEQVAGTNGIGTAIVADRFVEIIGSQHFFAENRFLACTAMPVHSPDGLLAGVLDISGNAHEDAEPAAQLVRHAVAHIEHRWAAASATDLLVHLHQHPSWLGTPDEGLLLFEDDILTGANSRALELLGLQAGAIGKAFWRDLFEERPESGRQALQPFPGRGLFYADVKRVRGLLV